MQDTTYKNKEGRREQNLYIAAELRNAASVLEETAEGKAFGETVEEYGYDYRRIHKLYKTAACLAISRAGKDTEPPGMSDAVIRKYLLSPYEEAYFQILGIQTSQADSIYLPPDIRETFREVIKIALGEREQKIFLLRCEEGYTYQEIGEDIGITLERVRQLYNRSIRRLRNPRFTEIIRYGKKVYGENSPQRKRRAKKPGNSSGRQ